MSLSVIDFVEKKVCKKFGECPATTARTLDTRFRGTILHIGIFKSEMTL